VAGRERASAGGSGRQVLMSLFFRLDYEVAVLAADRSESCRLHVRGLPTARGKAVREPIGTSNGAGQIAEMHVLEEPFKTR